jgi:hypothetical protein
MATEGAAKTFILVHYAALVAAGACDPTARVELGDEHRLLGTGVLRYLASGLSPTLDDLAWLMITAFAEIGELLYDAWANAAT